VSGVPGAHISGGVAGVSAHEAVGALREVGATIASLLPWQAATESNTLEGVPGRVQPLPNGERPCKLQRFGSGWGGHTLCARRYANHGNRGETRRGLALSYGISSDYSFDEAVAQQMGASVLAMDPTVKHKTDLAERVTFMPWGAPSAGAPSTWPAQGPAWLAQRLGSRLRVLKMDCEGCEFQMWKGATAEFFAQLDQLALEVHLSRTFLNNSATLLDYGRFLAALKRANLHLAHAELTACAPKDEATGLLPELRATGYRPKWEAPPSWANAPELHCENLLFVRPRNRRRGSAQALNDTAAPAR